VKQVTAIYFCTMHLVQFSILTNNSTTYILVFYTGCLTRYRTRHFFNNFTTNEDIATKFEADYRHIPFHFSHNERTPAISSLVLELLKKCWAR